MGKISPVSAKYIVHSQIQIDGVVDKPDVIGAIFGQTEGLLGSELELRELQRSGRIGRIEVKLDVKNGKSSGYIIIPSSLDKTETVIIGAALETIQRIGPCDSRVKIEKIEDVRVSKRNYVIERAKELLKNLEDTVLPDSQEITDQVSQSVRMMEVVEYGRDRLPAGPAIDESEEVIVCEGRADVLNLLRYGIKNVIGMNGTNVPETIKELSKGKTIIAFVDGDRGGDLILRELGAVAEIDYATKAPDGKEVEELTMKEIHKALRSKVAFEQVKAELKADVERAERNERPERFERREERSDYREVRQAKRKGLEGKEKEMFKSMLDKLVGTRGAYLLDKDSKMLGKVPVSELAGTVKGLKSVYAIVLDGIIDRDLVKSCERTDVKYIVAANSKINPGETRIEILTSKDLA